MAKALAAEIATEGKPIPARQTACLFLKNTLNAKSQGPQRDMHERWKTLDAGTRKFVKDNLLAAIRTPEPGIARLAAAAAAEVACVELPFQEWPEFMGAMTEAMNAPNIPECTKLASLECLGFTCERIDEVQAMIPDVPELRDETVNSMLTTIVQGVQPDKSDPMRLAALNALNKSLAFVHKNMEVPAERDFIVKNAICGAAQSSDSRLRELAFQCLDVVAELYYDKIQEYMTEIFRLTSNAIKNDSEEEVKMAAIDFWSTISMTEESLLEEEQRFLEEGRFLDRPPCKKYIESALQPLTPLLLETLSQQKEEMDEDDYDLRQAGAYCLEVMSVTVGALIVPLVVPFVQQYITSDNWRMRDAAIKAFSCIMEGPTTSVIGQYVNQAIPVLMGAFSDNHEMVRDSATLCISSICKLHVAAIQPDQVHLIVQGLLTKLQESPRLARGACSAIFNLSKSMKSTTDIAETNVLSAPMLPLMQALLATMDRTDAEQSNLRISAMAAAAELISASARDVQPILRDLLPVITQRMDAAFKMEVLSSDDRENQAQQLASLSDLVMALFQRLEKVDVMPHTDRVMEMLLQVLQVPNSNCHEEAFLCVGAVATSLEQDFMKYVQVFMPFLINGLRSFQSQSLCIVSVGVVVDLCSAVGPQIQPYCDQIMQAMTDCLKDSSAHRDTKPVVFSAFGDIAMAICAAFEPYLQVATMLLMQAASAPITSPEDDEFVEFINRLRKSVLDAYTGIIMGLADGKALHLFIPNIASIMQFLEFLSTPDSYKDDECLQKAVGLVGDIAQQMGASAQIKQQLNQPFISSLIREANASGSDGTREIAVWSQGILQQMISV
jgi:importin subunit beta-1